MTDTNNEFPDHLVPIIRDFHRIYLSLMILWGSKEFGDYMKNVSLVSFNRVSRQGFHEDVMRELFALDSEHQRVFPQFNSKDIWGIV